MSLLTSTLTTIALHMSFLTSTLTTNKLYSIISCPDRRYSRTIHEPLSLELLSLAYNTADTQNPIVISTESSTGIRRATKTVPAYSC
jgi:hypothetical protein